MELDNRLSHGNEWSFVYYQNAEYLYKHKRGHGNTFRCALSVNVTLFRKVLCIYTARYASHSHTMEYRVPSCSQNVSRIRHILPTIQNNSHHTFLISPPPNQQKKPEPKLMGEPPSHPLIKVTQMTDI
jgi:hypothetical protein